MYESAAHIPATCDEELLCCLGPNYPALAGSDPDRVAGSAMRSRTDFRR